MKFSDLLSNWDFYLVGSFPNGEPGGLMLNIILAVLPMSLSFVFGVLLGYSRLSSRIYVKLPCIAYIETVRATPLLVIIFWFYYVIPVVTGMHITVFWSVVISLAIYASAYQAEIVRSGITLVPKTQLEIALSTGFSRYRAMGSVILPQAFRMMVPSFVSFLATIFKDTSTVFIIGVMELTQVGFIVSHRQPDKVYAAYIIVAAGFFLICNSLSYIAEKLEKKIGVFDFQSYRPDVSRDEFMLFPKYKLQSYPSFLRSREKKKIKKYGMLIDLNRCIGCYACQVTCKAEHSIPAGIFRCKIETFQSGRFPDIKKLFMPRLCNQCEVPPCIEACDDKKAIVKTPEGVVIINHHLCPSDIKCEKCYEMCPYDAIDLHADTGKPEKCDFCYDRLQMGEQPVCAQSCMGKAITFGDMNDRKSEISKFIKRRQIKAINPEHGTYPVVFYLSEEHMSRYIPIKNYEIPKGRSAPKFPVTQLPSRTGDEDSSSRQYINTVDNMCPSECGITVRVEDGIARKIYGNPHSLINNGTLCAKGAAGLQLTYSPHRVKTPLLRTEERGEDKWIPVTWEYAADYITNKLIQIKHDYGEETVFFDGGDMTDGVAYERLFRAFGTPNILHHGSICDPNRQWGHKLITGDSRPLPDVQRPLLTRNDKGDLYLKKHHDAKLILNIGVNPFVATRFNYMSNGIPGARAENNCKYIVIDPSHTNSASLADIWLPIIPGTDASLMAAMLLYIIENCSYDYPSQCYIDEEFIDKFTVGWNEFKEAFLSYSRKRDPSNKFFYYSLAWAEEKTGIPSKDIEKISHLFGSTKPASIEVGMHGTAHHTNGDVTSILATVLCLITGNLDRPGGLVMMSPHKPKKGMKTSGHDFLSRQVIRKVNGTDLKSSLSKLQKDRYGDFPSAMKAVLIDLPGKMKKGIKISNGPFKGHAYPVKAFITRAGNPFITAGNTDDWINALNAKDNNGEYKVELNVYIDTHVSVTGRYADIILPEAGFLERMGLSSVYTMSPEVALKDKVIKPLYESRTPYEIMTSLSEAFIKNGDPHIRAEDFGEKYGNETGFINNQLLDTPGFFNIGSPLPYPDLPEGCRIIGTPDNPRALLGNKVIRDGDPLTVDWLRKNNGVAVWPASYYRYKKTDGSPSELCPNTASGKFEFKFGYLENINKKLGTNFPTSFYWNESKWNPKNILYKQSIQEYPFQLISGRVHHSMTITTVCPYLSETDTECMEPLNNDFYYDMPKLNGIPNETGMPDGKKILFKAGSVSIPVFAMNHIDGTKLKLMTGDIITLENPQKKRIMGKVFLTEEVMPSVIKTAFGPGGQKASGLGFINKTSEYTPNINELYDPNNFNPCTGTPGFGDILVKVIKSA